MTVIAACLLSGCDMRPDHAEWQDVCVESHDELLYYQTTYIQVGNVQTPLMTPIYNTVCDRSERQCVSGKDGSTVCK